MTTNVRSTHSDLPVPPGDYLHEVLDERGISQAELARRMGRPVQPINEIVKGRKAVTAQTALQLEAALGVPAHIWMGLESEYRLTVARRTLQAGRRSGAPGQGKPMLLAKRRVRS